MLADGLYCSLTCFMLKDDRHIPGLGDLMSVEGESDDHE